VDLTTSEIFVKKKAGIRGVSRNPEFPKVKRPPPPNGLFSVGNKHFFGWCTACCFLEPIGTPRSSECTSVLHVQLHQFTPMCLSYNNTVRIKCNPFRDLGLFNKLLPHHPSYTHSYMGGRSSRWELRRRLQTMTREEVLRLDSDDDLADERDLLRLEETAPFMRSTWRSLRISSIEPGLRLRWNNASASIPSTSQWSRKPRRSPRLNPAPVPADTQVQTKIPRRSPRLLGSRPADTQVQTKIPRRSPRLLASRPTDATPQEVPRRSLRLNRRP